MDAPRHEQTRMITAQTTALGLDQCARVVDDASSHNTQARTELDHQSSLIDTIAVEALAVPPSLDNACELHDCPPYSHLTAPDWSDAIVRRQIGSYLTTEHIATTETAILYRARRIENPTQQVVIKLIKGNRTSDDILNRFQNHIQLQAALAKHPNLIAFLDSGTTKDGHVYVVTDHVNGLPIDEYCDRKKLTLPARLALFIQVCKAIQFAHNYALIHRDLKPSNILVTADGIPRLINLGFAVLAQRETGGQSTHGRTKPTLTPTAELVLSPQYASPEQVRGEIITTGSDVYALGVILYQLLTGRSPYRLSSEDTADIFQAICEQVPEKPSLAVSRRLTDQPIAANKPSPQPTSAPHPRAELISPAVSPLPLTPDQIAQLRGLTALKLKRMLTGDLDAIILMAMRKEPECRYTSAEHFSEDLDRYLKSLPLMVQHATLPYCAQKFIKRHVTAVVVGLVLILALTSGLISTTIRLIMKSRDSGRAQRSFVQARHTVDEFFTRIHEDQLLNQPGFYSLRNALLMDTQHFYENFLQDHGADPTLRAEKATAQARIAETIHLTGSPDHSIAHFQAAVTSWDRLIAEQPSNERYRLNLAQTLSNFGTALITLEGRLDEASAKFRRAQELVEPLIAADPGSVNLRAELSTILLKIAEIQRRQGKLDEAIMSLEHVVAMDSQVVRREPESIELEISFSMAHAMLGRLLATQPDQWLQAAAAYDRAVELGESLCRKHPELANQSYHLALELSELSNLEQKLGQSDIALESSRRALQIFERMVQMHPNIAPYQEGLGITYNLLSDLECQRAEKGEALAFAQKARTMFEQLLAANRQDTSCQRYLAKSCSNIGRLLAQAGKPMDALRAFQRSIDLVETLSQLTAQDSYNLACSAALCIPLIGLNNRSEGTLHELTRSDQIRRRRYGDRAIEALRHSAIGGFLSAENFQNTTDLDSLRTRPDFQALMKQVEENSLSAGK